MRILYLQAVGGASGDMILAALISLGVDPRDLEAPLTALTSASIRLRTRTVRSHGLHGLQLTVDAAESDPSRRRYAEIRDLLDASGLPVDVRDRAQAAFRRLADAEAQVHEIPVDDVHFHEVGSLDSIADVVGSCLALSRLEVDRVVVAPLPVGQGEVRCAHGVYPVPAPATAWLLRDVPIRLTDEPYELTTPTAAALLTTWASADRVPEGARIRRVGHAFGHRTLTGRPNLLRGLMLEWTAPAAGEDCWILECQLDDTVPELIGQAATALLAAGALDVYTTAVQMKKQRPGALLTVLCTAHHKDALVDMIFRETTTLGVREHAVRRTMLPRRVAPVETPFGPVRVKVGAWRGAEITAAPEMEDCIARAAEAAVPVRRVYEAAQRAAAAGGWGIASPGAEATS